MRKVLSLGLLMALTLVAALVVNAAVVLASPGNDRDGSHDPEHVRSHSVGVPRVSGGDVAANPAPAPAPQAPPPASSPSPATPPAAPPAEASPAPAAPAPPAASPSPGGPAPGASPRPFEAPRVPSMNPEGQQMPDEATIIRSIEIQGNQEVPTADVLQVVTSRIGEPADKDKIQRDVQNIYEMGFFTDVKVRTTPFLDGAKITYNVLENPKVRSIQIEGNKIVPTAKLRSLMETREGRILNTKTLFADITVVNRYYDNELGYLLEPTHVTQLKFTPDGDLRMQVTEGIVVRDIKITGNTVIKAKDLTPLVRMRVGQLFNQFTMKEDAERLSKYYEKRDYILDNIRPSVNKGEGTVSYQVVEASVEEIKVEGNTRTRSFVIRRLMRTKVGAVLKRTRLQHDLERLNSSGYFESVNIEPEPGSDTGKVVLVLKVKEQKTGMATLGLGWSGGGTGALRSGITGAISFSERNLKGRGQSASASWQRGVNIQSYGVSYFDPAINEAQDSIGFSFFRSEFSDLRQPVLLNDGSTGYALYNDNRTGGSVTYGKYVGEDIRAFLTFKKEHLDITQSASSLYTPVGLGTGAANSLTLSALHDTRDDLFNPHRGTYANLGFSVSGGPLGGVFNYTKAQVEARHYIPMQKNTFAFRGWAGWGNGDLPVSEYFYIGGSDTLRAYQENAFIGNRFVVVNAEYRFPIANLKMLNGTIFADAGGAWFGGQPMKIYKDAGVGLRIVFPSLGLGVIRLDYAFGEKGNRSSIGLGQTF